MHIERPARHLPVFVAFHNKWWHDRFGFIYDEAHTGNPDYVVERIRKSSRILYDHFGHLGVGAENPVTRSGGGALWCYDCSTDFWLQGHVS